MPFPHQHLATTISDRLNVLADQLKTRTRASHNDANHWLESVMARFFNALMGWNLVNLNAEHPNFPAADLGDKALRIALQVTNQDAADKITETAKKAVDHRLHEDFDKIIILFLLPEKPGMPKKFVQPADGPLIECWDLADLLKQMPELPDQSRLEAALKVLNKDLGIKDEGNPVYFSNLPGLYTGCLFVGRDDFLKDLRASLLRKTHVTAITHSTAATGIAGLGGIGKTHTAVEYAHQHHADYTATLFISGDSPERLDAGFSALFDILQLGGMHETVTDQTVRITAVKKWFTTHHDWLLIIDNVDDENAAAALAGYFNVLATGHLLITSCLQNWADNVDALNIEVLSPVASTSLLLQLTDKNRRKTSDDESQARKLAEAMDGLPLALHQAAGYINEQRLTFADYLMIYEQEAADLLGWFKNHVIHYERLDKDTPKPVLITWKTSFDKLDEDTRFWLLVFSHFAPDPIPEFLLDSAPAAKDEVKVRHHAARQALAQAESYSLLTRADDSPRFKLHRLVQHILRLSAAKADVATALAAGILLIHQSASGDSQDANTWPRWNLLKPHAISLVAHAPDDPSPEFLAWLLNQLGLLLKTQALYAQAEPLLQRALEIDEASYGAEHPEVARALNNLGMLFMSTNRLGEAEPLMRRAVAIFENSLGRDHPNLASALSNLGSLFHETNRFPEAEQLMRRALEVTENSLGKDHPNVAANLSVLASLLQDTNRLAEAEPLMRRALAIDEACFGAEHPNVALRLNILARLLQATNRIEEAELLMRRALDIDETSYGLEHPNVAAGLNNLSVLLQSTNRLEESETLIRRALSIDEASYGTEHSSVARDLNNLANLLKDSNRFAEAEPLMRRALDIFVLSLGKDHLNVAKSLNNLAFLLQDTNRQEEAEPLMCRALGILVRSLGPEHPNSKAVLANYLGLLLALGVPEEEWGKRVKDAIGG